MRISVVIPALNEAGNIGRLVEETYASVPAAMLAEVIVVDDHSDDATGTEVKGNLYTSAGDDPNHFDPRYFGAGKTWKDPKLNRVLANYSLAKAVYESDGRRIVNCTVGGALEAFDRVDLADFVRR